jgi:hypothetical protein
VNPGLIELRYRLNVSEKYPTQRRSTENETAFSVFLVHGHGATL